MVTIEHKGKKYTFKDRFTVEDWLNMPNEENAKKTQVLMIAAMSIEPKLTFEEIIKQDFDFMNKIMLVISPSGE